MPDHPHQHWLPDRRPAGPEQAAMHRLAAAIRQTIGLLLDSDAAAGDLAAAAEAAERFNERLAAGPRGRPLWGFAETSTSGDPRAFYDSSPLSGLANPLSPPIVLRVVDGEVRGEATFGLQYEGPPGHVHGGFIAAAFDEVLGMAQSTTGNPGMTGTLTVRYRQPTPLYRELTFRGRVDRVEGRKIFTQASLHAGETLCAEAEGLFISVGEERFRRLAGE
jgi:acyl-coenzyme A thioesterase PaaI-like protein